MCVQPCQGYCPFVTWGQDLMADLQFVLVTRVSRESNKSATFTLSCIATKEEPLKEVQSLSHLNLYFKCTASNKNLRESGYIYLIAKYIQTRTLYTFLITFNFQNYITINTISVERLRIQISTSDKTNFQISNINKHIW